MASQTTIAREVNKGSAISNPDLVSVIVPTFKRYDFLQKTLESILAQSHQHLELLVVADGHDEQTRAVVDGLNDGRACYHSIEHRGLPAAPRNEGLRRCQGQWIAFCDDDDLWHKDKLELQIPVLRDSNYSLCTTDYDYIDHDGILLPMRNYYANYEGKFTWETFYHSMGFICNAAALFSRDVFETVGYVNEDPKLRAHEDFEYWMRLLFQNEGFFMKQKLVSYRVHGGSIQRGSAFKVFRKRLALLNSLSSTLPVPLNHRAVKFGKTGVHFLLDQFPVARKTFRRLQGRTESV